MTKQQITEGEKNLDKTRHLASKYRWENEQRNKPRELTEDDKRIQRSWIVVQSTPYLDWQVVSGTAFTNMRDAEQLKQQILTALQEYPKLKESYNKLGLHTADIICDLKAENERLIELKNMWYSTATENGETIQKLQQQIKELNKDRFSQGVEFGNAHVMPESSFQYMKQEINQLRKLKKKVEDRIKQCDINCEDLSYNVVLRETQLRQELKQLIE